MKEIKKKYFSEIIEIRISIFCYNNNVKFRNCNYYFYYLHCHTIILGFINWKQFWSNFIPTLSSIIRTKKDFNKKAALQFFTITMQIFFVVEHKMNCRVHSQSYYKSSHRFNKLGFPTQFFPAFFFTCGLVGRMKK